MKDLIQKYKDKIAELELSGKGYGCLGGYQAKSEQLREVVADLEALQLTAHIVIYDYDGPEIKGVFLDEEKADACYEENRGRYTWIQKESITI